MKKNHRFIGLLTASMIFASAYPTMAEGEPITDYCTYQLQTLEIDTFNILHTQSSSVINVLTNLVDGLVELDNYGKLVPAIAESWETSDDGVTWTFHLRNGVKWVDVNGIEKAECTAKDFLTGLEWILNAAKNESYNASMPMELIKGASEYYDYTKGLSEEEAKALTADGKFSELVGIKAIDDYTLEYTCVGAKPYFDTVAAYNCLYPLAQGLVDELGVDGLISADNTNIWYNGCYMLTEYVQNNEKVFTKNPLYWDEESTRFDTVTVKMVDSVDTAYQMYLNGEIDNIDLTESNLNMIYNNESDEYHDYLIEKLPDKSPIDIHFNYGMCNEDMSSNDNWNTAIANEAFRKCWYYGLDLGNYYKRTNSINPYMCYSNSYTASGLAYFSDGKDYSKYVQELLGEEDADGESMGRLDSEKYEEYKKQAIEELTAKGVTFPVEADYYIPASNQTELDTATVLKQAFSDSFGDDFIVLNIKTYVQSMMQEVSSVKKQSFVINGWGADYGDPQNFLVQEVNNNENAFIATLFGNLADITDDDCKARFDEYSKMVADADSITSDLDERYKAFAEAEEYLIEHVLVLPISRKMGWELTKVNDYSKINGIYGAVNNKYKNWETNSDGYTSEEYAQLKAEYESGLSK